MKKIFAMILVLTLALTMAACGGNDTSSVSEQSSQPEESVSTPAETSEESSVASVAEGVVLPDLEGFEKTEQTTMGIQMTMYQAADNSVIIVMGLGADEEIQKLFAEKDADAQAQLNTAMAQQLAQYAPDITVDGSFETVEGKDAYVFSTKISGDSMGAPGVEVDMLFYMVATANGTSNVIGMSMGEDIAAELTEIIKAL